MIRATPRGFVSVLTILAFCWTFLLAPVLATAQEEEEPATVEETAAVEHPAATPDYNTVCLQAEGDASAQHSANVYILAGFLCGIIGCGAAAIAKPAVPAENLVGQSAEYVRIYEKCYQDKAKKKNITAACSGWLAGAAVVLAVQSATGNL